MYAWLYRMTRPRLTAASNPQATSAWIPRRSSFILRIAPRQPGLSQAQLILLISQAANKDARFHPEYRLRTQAGHDRLAIQTVPPGRRRVASTRLSGLRGIRRVTSRARRDRGSPISENSRDNGPHRGWRSAKRLIAPCAPI